MRRGVGEWKHFNLGLKRVITQDQRQQGIRLARQQAYFPEYLTESTSFAELLAASDRNDINSNSGNNTWDSRERGEKNKVSKDWRAVLSSS